MRQLRNFDGRNHYGKPNRSQEELVQEAMQKYGGLDENALLAQLNRQVAASKANGTFNPAEVLEFASRISPMLSEAQREKLADLLREMGCE